MAFLELERVDDIQNFFNFIQEHDLLGRVDLGPVLEQTEQDLFGQGTVLLKELNYAVRQLRMIQRQRLDFVQRDEHACQEQLVFVFERKCEAVDNRSKNLQQFGDSVMTFCLVDELIEDIIDGPPDEGSKI